jgi:hypothetical protein
MRGEILSLLLDRFAEDHQLIGSCVVLRSTSECKHSWTQQYGLPLKAAEAFQTRVLLLALGIEIVPDLFVPVLPPRVAP